MNKNALPWYESEAGPGFVQTELVVHALLSRKGENIVVLDLRGRSDVADYFVIVSGNSDVQVGALAKGVEDDLRAAGHKPKQVEGRDRLSWVLLDYFDVVVHVQQQKVRGFYDLERLWNDAGRLEVAQDYFAKPAVARRHPDLQLVRQAATSVKPGTEEPS